MSYTVVIVCVFFCPPHIYFNLTKFKERNKSLSIFMIKFYPI